METDDRKMIYAEKGYSWNCPPMVGGTVEALSYLDIASGHAWPVTCAFLCALDVTMDLNRNWYIS